MCECESNLNRDSSVTKPDVLNFLLGERKIIQFEVISLKKEPVVIVDASWVLTYQDGTVETGAVTITDDSIMEITLQPMAKGTHEMMITYTVAPEIRKVRCKVFVR